MSIRWRTRTMCSVRIGCDSKWRSLHSSIQHFKSPLCVYDECEFSSCSFQSFILIECILYFTFCCLKLFTFRNNKRYVMTFSASNVISEERQLCFQVFDRIASSFRFFREGNDTFTLNSEWHHKQNNRTKTKLQTE
jgi:hypothetical protein